MNRNNTKKLIFTFILAFSAVFVLFSSCRRNKDCDLNLTIQDGVTSGGIGGAAVSIGPSQTNTNGTLQIQVQNATTDANGVANFTFKLPAILSATITMSGYTTKIEPVKLEEGRSVSKVIKLF